MVGWTIGGADRIRRPTNEFPKGVDMTTASATAASDQDNVEQTDVLVIGAGMAGLCAAIAARHAGASVIVLEKAPEAERGGNTRFSNGAIRAVYHGVEDIDALVGGLSALEGNARNSAPIRASSIMTTLPE
jgi:NADPH-dependent 2,4-dienoyl-CoA reductase/sulfur reductase-like enzyme